MVKWLLRIISLARNNGKVPEDWRKAVIVPVHKERKQVEVYQGISLLNIPSKVYARILSDERIRHTYDRK